MSECESERERERDANWCTYMCLSPIIKFIPLVAKFELYKESDVWGAIQRVVRKS